MMHDLIEPSILLIGPVILLSFLLRLENVSKFKVITLSFVVSFIIYFTGYSNETKALICGLAFVASLMFFLPKDRKGVEAVIKILSFLMLGHFLLLLHSLWRFDWPVSVESFFFLLGMGAVLGLPPFHRPMVDFIDGSNKAESCGILYIHRIGLLILLRDIIYEHQQQVLFLAAGGVFFSSLLMLGQSNLRRVIGYFNIVISCLVVLNLCVPGGNAFDLLLITFLPGLSLSLLNSNIEFQSLGVKTQVGRPFKLAFIQLFLWSCLSVPFFTVFLRLELWNFEGFFRWGVLALLYISFVLFAYRLAKQGALVRRGQGPLSI